MAHHVYTTEGLVLHLSPRRESDKEVVIFTKELGLVRAIARGIREERSRLRMSLFPEALVKASFVHGKSGWRMTTVTLLADYHSLLREKKPLRNALVRITRLLQSLIQGEEANSRLYEELTNSLERLHTISTNEASDWELWTVARILIPLGYMAENEAPQSIEEAKTERKKILTLVNEHLRESGLYKV